MRAVLFSLLCVVVAAMPLRAQRFSALGVTDVEAAKFFTALQKAVGANDRPAVVRMVNYPLHISEAHAHRRTIADAADLLRQYNSVFTPVIRTAIVNEHLATVFVNKDGIAIQRGMVWVNGACNRQRPPACHLGLESVNLP